MARQFDSAKHPRSGDGQFTGKPVADPPASGGGMSLSEAEPAGRGVWRSRFNSGRLEPIRGDMSSTTLSVDDGGTTRVFTEADQPDADITRIPGTKTDAPRYTTPDGTTWDHPLDAAVATVDHITGRANPQMGNAGSFQIFDDDGATIAIHLVVRVAEPGQPHRHFHLRYDCSVSG